MSSKGITLRLSVFAVAAWMGPLVSTAYASTINPQDWITVPQKPNPNLENLGIPADAASKGMWSKAFDWPMNGLHAALLADGRVLSFGTTPYGQSQNGRWFDVWDPALGMAGQAHNTVYDPKRQDSFCATAAYLPDGNLLITGGNDSTTSTVYDPSSHSSYTDSATLAEDRWYSTMINLADGRPIILGGMVPYTEEMADDPDLAVANGLSSLTPEVYESGRWRSLFGAYSRDAFGHDSLRTSYPRAWVAPNGKVFGISSDKMWYLDPDANGGNGEISGVWDFKQPYNRNNPVNAGSTSSAVMFAPGQVLQVGGNGGYHSDKLPASNRATVIDFRNGAPQLTEQASMSHARRYPNVVVLADGKVVVSGGTTYGNHYAREPGDAVYEAELWDPVSGQWTRGASAGRIRVYHSITTLLPDGTVLSTGGGNPGPVTNLNAEIYYPPYLFEAVNGVSRLAQRPVIKAISGLSYQHSADLQLDMDSENPVQQLVLLGLSSGTHSFNTGQRRIALSFSQQRFRLTAKLPVAELAPPGYYQVVALDAKGTPSLGVIIGIGQGQTPPAVVVSPYEPPTLEQPIETPVITAGATVSYGISPETGVSYSWSFSDTGETTAYSTNPRVSHRFAVPGLYVVTLSARSSSGAVNTKTVVQAVSTDRTSGTPSSSSQLVFEARGVNGDRIWTVNPDNDSVSVLSAAAKNLLTEIKVGASPRALAIAPNGTVWVSNKLSADISVIDSATLKVQSTIALPRASQPHGLVFSPKGAVAFLVLEGSGQLLKLDAQTGVVLATVNLGAHVRELAITGDGRQLLVSRFITPPLPGESDAHVNPGRGGAELLVVDSSTLQTQRTITLRYSDLPDNGLQGSGIPNYLAAAVIAPDGKNAWLPSKQDNVGRGLLRNGQPLNFENTVRAIASYINLDSQTENLGLRVDFDNSSVASAAAYHPNGVYLFVALETSREVAVVNGLDGTELFRVEVGVAPQALTLSDDGLTLYVKEFMERRVSVLDLRPLIKNGQLRAPVIARVNTVLREALAANVLAGKKLFYDARDPRLALDRYLSCATCHNDGGQDGRVWDFTGFGEGLRNTIALNGRAALNQGFLHWSANFDEVQDFEQQIRTLSGGTGLMADGDYFAGTREQPLGDKKAGLSRDLDNLAAYIESLNRFEPSPYRQAKGELTANAQHGKVLFAEQCQACHGASAFSLSRDASSMKDIGTLTTASGQRLGLNLDGIDIPTLRDAWATAPYLHDGSAASLADAIRAHKTLTLTGAQINSLAAYVQQIGGEEPGAGLFADGRWEFNEGVGNRVADASGKDQPLQLRYTQWEQDRAGYVGKFNGLSSVASSSGPVLDTADSFSVSAWVKLDHLYNWQTVASQDGTQVSGFGLQYSRALGRKFAFSMSQADNDNSEVDRALSTTSVEKGRWYHLVGVRDRQAGTLKLYVNGILEATARSSARWQADGSFNVGRGLKRSPRDWADAAIDDVSVYRYALTEGDVALLYAADRPNYKPSIELLAPVPQSLFKEGADIVLEAAASDADDAVAGVRFYNGSELLATLDSAPYRFTWSHAPIGAHSITALVSDARGAESTTAPLVVVVEDARVQNLAASATLDTSFVSRWENLAAVIDGFEPLNSRDHRHGAYGNLNGSRSFGLSNWVTLSWDKPQHLTTLEVYWWSDGLGIREPTLAELEYWDGSQWLKLGDIGTRLDTYNRLAVDVSSSKIRLSMSGQRATGILEIKVKGYP